MGFNGDLYPTAGATSVMTTKGDMVDYNTARQRLGIGSANQILQVKSSLPSWETVDLADTVLTTAGDVLYENNTPELARLPKGSDADVLTLASGLPSWSAPAGGGAWEQAFQGSASGANILDSGTITFKQYMKIFLSFDGFDLQSNTNYKIEALFNNDSSDGYDSRYMQNANSGTSLTQNNLDIFQAGGVMSESSKGCCITDMVNISGEPKYGNSQGSWYVDGQSASYYNSSSVWWQFQLTDLITQVEVSPSFDASTYDWADATMTIFHAD